MNFQEKVIEASAELRGRAAAFATAAIDTALLRARRAARQAQGFRKSFVVLNDAGQQLSRVARLHAGRFIKQNSPLVAAVRKDVADLARTTLAALGEVGKPSKTVRKTATSRKRTRKSA